jgi:hypothetical protein
MQYPGIGEHVGNKTMATAQMTNQMSAAQFDAQWSTLLEQERADATTFKATWDQKKARFLADSGWTQEAIAERIGKTHVWVCYYLRFGRFLEHVVTSGYNDPPIPANLTERTFRTAWAACKGPSDEARFDLVVHPNAFGCPPFRDTTAAVLRTREFDQPPPNKHRVIQRTVIARQHDFPFHTLDQLKQPTMMLFIYLVVIRSGRASLSHVRRIKIEKRFRSVLLPDHVYRIACENHDAL